ncbi:MAG: 4Fe-4S dicluster domain-containing protein [Proteobacteria bacterium]|nr:4Fe-4S dicluster domain-containing protein [Pseudomonadota bacterium]
MSEMILKKSDLADFFKSLAAECQLLGPVEDGGRIKFAPADPGVFLLDFQNTFMSPKNLFFPQSERLLTFTTDSSDEKAFILEDSGDKPAPRAVFGIRPCDAKAFQVLDRIFRNDQYEDPYWFQKREATTLIGLGCNRPCPTCFCTSVNCGPFHEEGLDVLATDLGDQLLLKGLTEKGEALLSKAKGLKKADKKALEAAAGQKTASEEAITVKVPQDQIPGRSVLDLFEAEHWERVHESCLNCGTCTFVCPTCHCFDIQDEVCRCDGDRVRNWDSCMSWLFTMHGSGHNPRPGKKERVRQRFMHKFKYIPIKRDGEIGCVGCGRCINLCPVNIDVRDVVRNMNA